MRVLSAPTISKAHELAVKAVLEKGWIIETEDGEATIECEELTLQVDNPLSEPMISEFSPFQKVFMDKYAGDLLNGSDGVFEYDYHGRLFEYGGHVTCQGWGHIEDPIDQIEYIIKKLREAPQSRRAQAITWRPEQDEEAKDVPCLQQVQCLIRDGKLQMKVVFRSNDILTAAGANMYALVHLQKMIAEKLGVSVGRYTHIALVPHIYFSRDAEEVRRFSEGLGIKPA